MRRQLARIEANASSERSNRAYKAYQRYRNNIQKSKSWANEYARAEAMQNDNYDGARAVVRQANSRKYSQNTYMGLNQG